MKISSRIALGVFINWVGIGVTCILGFIIIPILLLRFGKDGYGLIVLIGVVLSLRRFLDFGLSGALTRELAAEIANGRSERLNKIISTCFGLSLAMGTILACISFLLAHLIVEKLNIPQSLHNQGLFLTRYYISFTFLLSFICPVYRAVIMGSNRFDLSNTVSLIVSILRALTLIFVIAYTETMYFGWVGVMISSQIIELVMLQNIAYRVYPSLKITIASFSPTVIPSLLILGIQLFFLNVIDVIGVTTDSFVLTIFLGPAAVALYTPPMSLTNQVRPIVDSMKDQLHPLATSYSSLGRNAELQQILVQGTRYRLLMGIFACVTLSIFAEPILSCWLGKSLPADNIRQMANILIIWNGIQLMTYAAGTQWPVLIGMRRMTFMMYLEIPMALVNLLASVFLVGYTSIGIIGVLIPTIVIATIKRPIIAAYCAHQVGLSTKEYFLSAYRKPFVVLALLLIMAELIRWLFNPQGIILLCSCVFLIGVVWLFLCWFIGLGDQDKASIMRVMIDLKGKIISVGMA